MRKFALALMAAAAAVFGFGLVAQAQVYPPPALTVTVGSATVTPGADVVVTVTGCTPGTTVTVELEDVSVTVTCEAAGGALGSIFGLIAQTEGTGTATATVTAPDEPGTYTGSVTTSDGASASFQVTVLAPTAPAGGLPATGSGGISTTTGIAIGLFAVGLGLLGVSQIRRRQAAGTA